MELFHSASIQGSALNDAVVYLVLLTALVLIYIGDISQSRAVMTIIAAVLLLYYPFHEHYLYTTYDFNTCHIMAGFLALPVMAAYAIYRVAEKQKDRGHLVMMLALGFFLVFCACSLDTLNLEQFKMFQGTIQ